MKHILIGPIISEKTMNLTADGKYTFEIAKNCNKPEVAEAVENIYKVNVESIKTISIKGKVRKFRGRVTGKTKDWKKAIVRLKKGQKILDFEVKEQK